MKESKTGLLKMILIVIFCLFFFYVVLFTIDRNCCHEPDCMREVYKTSRYCEQHNCKKTTAAISAFPAKDGVGVMTRGHRQNAKQGRNKDRKRKSERKLRKRKPDAGKKSRRRRRQRSGGGLIATAAPPRSPGLLQKRNMIPMMYGIMTVLMTSPTSGQKSSGTTMMHTTTGKTSEGNDAFAPR